MFVHVHLPPSYTVSASAASLRGVRCENCDTDYLYKLTRKVSETKRGVPPSVMKEGLAERAKKAAEKGVDPVPCPECGYLQRRMVRAMKLERIAWLVLIAIPLMFLVALISFVSLIWAYVFSAILLSGVLSAVVLIVLYDPNILHRMEKRRCNPNLVALRRRDFPGELPEDLFPERPI